MKRPLSTWIALAVILPVLGIAAPAGSMEHAVDGKAESILKSAAEYLKHSESFVFHAEITVDGRLEAGEWIQYGASLEAALKRPHFFKTRYSGDLKDSASWYDGKTFTFLDRRENLYADWEAPGTIDTVLEKIREKLGFMLPLSDLFYSDPHSILMEGVKTGRYAGLHRIEGEKYHHLVFSQEVLDWQVWIEEGNRPLLKKMVITYKETPGAPQYAALFTWDFSAPLPEFLFVFEPPDGAERIEFLPSRKE